MLRGFIIFSILIYTGSSCLAQNPDGRMLLSLRDGCKKINFIINKDDSIFYDKNNEFKLKVYGSYSSREHFSLYSQGRIDYRFLPNNGKARLQRNSTKLLIGTGWSRRVKIELEEVKSNEIMVVEFENRWQRKFSTEFKFKSGEYTVDVGRKAIGKPGMFSSVKQRYFEKKSTNY